MDDTIINNWNKVVEVHDTVYHLGDFCWGHDYKIRSYRERLNGKIHLVRGNHDKTWKWKRETRELFESIHNMNRVTLRSGMLVIMCHFAMRVWDRSHFNSYHLYGHSHGILPSMGKSFDAGVDCNEFTPLHELQIIDIMGKLPDNEAYKVIQRERNK